MKTFKKWDGKAVKDNGAFMSEEAKSYVRAFRTYLKRSFSEAEIVGFKPNHYDTSGFLIIDGVCVYVSMEVPRWGARINFSDGGYAGGILYRTAKDIHDFRGDENHFTSMFELVENIKALVNRKLYAMERMAG